MQVTKRCRRCRRKKRKCEHVNDSTRSTCGSCSAAGVICSISTGGRKWRTRSRTRTRTINSNLAGVAGRSQEQLCKTSTKGAEQPPGSPDELLRIRQSSRATKPDSMIRTTTQSCSSPDQRGALERISNTTRFDISPTTHAQCLYR
jgi:hypothetical protein